MASRKKARDGDGQELQEEFVPQINISAIKNKVKRAEAYKKMKREQKKVKKTKRKMEKKEAKAMGEDAPPKKVPKTIESMRVYDETMVDPEDDEVIADEGLDECAGYFNRDTTPKILITTCQRSSSRTKRFCQELETCIPNSTVVRRHIFKLKKVIPEAIEKEYTDLIVINENRRKPDGMLICHLPDGPTANFRVSNVKFNKEIRKSGQATGHRPELILNNFNTRLGHSIGRMIASLFPHEPEFLGRRVVTFHNQRDYVFFRHHRYQFRNAKRAGLLELGPRFTLKLRSLQKGTFDTKYGEYEWVHKRHEMEASRRKFAL